MDSNIDNFSLFNYEPSSIEQKSTKKSSLAEFTDFIDKFQQSQDQSAPLDDQDFFPFASAVEKIAGTEGMDCDFIASDESMQHFILADVSEERQCFEVERMGSTMHLTNLKPEHMPKDDSLSPYLVIQQNTVNDQMNEKTIPSILYCPTLLGDREDLDALQMVKYHRNNYLTSNPSQSTAFVKNKFEPSLNFNSFIKGRESNYLEFFGKSCYLHLDNNELSLNIKKFGNLNVLITSTLMIQENQVHKKDKDRMSAFIHNSHAIRDQLDQLKVWMIFALNNINKLQMFRQDEQYKRVQQEKFIENNQMLHENGIEIAQVRDVIHRSTNLLKYIKIHCDDPQYKQYITRNYNSIEIFRQNVFNYKSNHLSANIDYKYVISTIFKQTQQLIKLDSTEFNQNNIKTENLKLIKNVFDENKEFLTYFHSIKFRYNEVFFKNIQQFIQFELIKCELQKLRDNNFKSILHRICPLMHHRKQDHHNLTLDDFLTESLPFPKQDLLNLLIISITSLVKLQRDCELLRPNCSLLILECIHTMVHLLIRSNDIIQCIIFNQLFNQQLQLISDELVCQRCQQLSEIQAAKFVCQKIHMNYDFQVNMIVSKTMLQLNQMQILSQLGLDLKEQDIPLLRFIVLFNGTNSLKIADQYYRLVENSIKVNYLNSVKDENLNFNLISELERKQAFDPSIIKKLKSVVKHLLQLELSNALLEKASIQESMDSNSIDYSVEALDLANQSINLLKKGGVSIMTIRQAMFVIDRLGNKLMNKVPNLIEGVKDHLEWIQNQFTLSCKDYLDNDEQINYALKLIYGKWLLKFSVLKRKLCEKDEDIREVLQKTEFAYELINKALTHQAKHEDNFKGDHSKLFDKMDKLVAMQQYQTNYTLDFKLKKPIKNVIFQIDGLNKVFNDFLKKKCVIESIDTKNKILDILDQSSEQKKIGTTIVCYRDIIKFNNPPMLQNSYLRHSDTSNSNICDKKFKIENGIDILQIINILDSFQIIQASNINIIVEKYPELKPKILEKIDNYIKRFINKSKNINKEYNLEKCKIEYDDKEYIEKLINIDLKSAIKNTLKIILDIRKNFNQDHYKKDILMQLDQQLIIFHNFI